MGKRIKLREANVLHDRSIFFDANILIYLFWPTGSVYYEENYASTFRTLLRQGNQLVVDFLVISEVINRVLRIEYQKQNSSLKFKDFRDSLNGQEALNDIHLILKNDVLSRFDVIEKSFSKNEILEFLIVNELDFVDKATVQFCRENSLVLLTNDKDFRNADIDVLTGHPAFFN